MEKAAVHEQGCDADKLLGICGSTFFSSITLILPLERAEAAAPAQEPQHLDAI